MVSQNVSKQTRYFQFSTTHVFTGEPKAKITCYFNQTLSSNAIVLKSRFNKETLNVTDCEGDSAEAMPAVMFNFYFLF